LIREGVPSAGVRVLRNAWAPKALLSRGEARRRLGLTEGDRVIGWVGRFTREKGADLFLQSLALLPDRHWRASIIGDGRERLALQALAISLGLADRVQWHGLVPQAASLYPAFDAWVLSSRTEGTPIALFEAMAARVPAVVTAVGGVPDIVSRAEALLVPPESPGALAMAIADVLGDTVGASTRAEAAHRRLEEAFPTMAWLEAHVALYQALQLPKRLEA
jgi:L-malate glycosyltransferase